MSCSGLRLSRLRHLADAAGDHWRKTGNEIGIGSAGGQYVDKGEVDPEFGWDRHLDAQCRLAVGVHDSEPVP